MTATATLGMPSFSARRVNTGTSIESKKLESMLGKALTYYWRTAPRNLVLNELRKVYADCQREGWDGYSAHPISADAYHAAVRFLLSLPAAFPMPDVVPEPDGEISLEWDYGRWKALSLSIGENGRISYAAMLGKYKRDKGTEIFDDFIPPEIVWTLWKVTHG